MWTFRGHYSARDTSQVEAQGSSLVEPGMESQALGPETLVLVLCHRDGSTWEWLLSKVPTCICSQSCRSERVTRGGKGSVIPALQ